MLYFYQEIGKEGSIRQCYLLMMAWTERQESSWECLRFTIKRQKNEILDALSKHIKGFVLGKI
jgi:hypothetical protein